MSRQSTRNPARIETSIARDARLEADRLRAIRKQRPLTRWERIVLSRDGFAPRPLPMFPKKDRERIEWQVAQDSPPPRWIRGDTFQIESRAWYEWHWQRDRFPNDASRREPIPQRLRQRVIERDGHVCGICGGDVEPDDIHIDHIHPYSLGGKTALGNLQVAHSACNIRKGARVG